MKAIEFQSHLIDGKILVPAECGLQEGRDVRVLILVEDATRTSRPAQSPKQSIWDQIEGSWQGDPLVREDQGEYANATPTSKAYEGKSI